MVKKSFGHKDQQPNYSDLANNIANHLTNIRKLVLDADELVRKANAEANAIKRLIKGEDKNE
jgi:hypothetical protein